MIENSKKDSIPDEKKKSALRWRGRLRKWAILFSIVVVIFISLFVFLQSSTFERWLTGVLTEKLEAYTGRDVNIDNVSLRLPKIAIEIENLVIHGFAEDKRPFLKVKKVYLKLRLLSIFDRELRFNQAKLERPELSIVLDKAGRMNLPLFPGSGESGDGFFRLVVDNFNIMDGLFYFNNMIVPASGDISGFKTEIRYDPENHTYLGKLTFTDGRANVAEYKGLSARLMLRFIFLPDRLILPEVRLNVSGIDVVSSGVIYDFENLRYNFDYSGTWRLGLLSDVFRLPIKLRGSGLLRGIMKSSSEGFLADGTLTITETPIGPFSAGNISSHFYFTPSLIQFTEIKADIFDGKINGSFVLKTKEEKTDYFLQCFGEGFAINRILEDVGFGGLGLHSDSDMQFAFNWSENEPRMVTGKLDILMKKDEAIEQRFKSFVLGFKNECRYRPVGEDKALTTPISLSGDIHFSIDKGKWKFHTGDITLPLTRFVFYGNGELLNTIEQEIKIESHEIKEIDILLLRLVRVINGWDASNDPWPGGEMPPPFVGLRGAAHFRGRFEQKKDKPFVLYGNAAGKRIWAHNTYFDEGGARFSFKENHIRFTKGWSKKGKASAKFSGEIHLFETPPENVNFLVLKAELDSFPCEDVLDLFFYPRDLYGSANGDFDLVIDNQSRIKGGMDVEISNGTLYKDKFDKGRVNLRFDNRWLYFDKIVLTKGNQKVDMALNINLEESAYKISGTAENVRLEELLSLYLDRSPLGGTIDFNIKGEGYLYKPTFEISGKVKDMSFFRKDLGTMDFDINGEAGHLALDAFLERDNTNIELLGDIFPDYRFDVNLSVQEINLYKLLPLTGGLIDRVFGGNVSGEARLRGNVREIGDVLAEGALRDCTLRINNYTLSLSEEAEFTINDFIVTLPGIEFTDGEGKIGFSGEIGLSRRFPSNLKISYDLDLAELVPMFDNLSLRGSMKGDGYFRGFVLDPWWGGKGQITEAYLNYPNLPAPFDNMNGRIEFSQNSVSLENFEGAMGGGAINTSGQLTFKNSKPDRLLFRANGDNVVLVYPKGVESVITGSLNLSGNWENKTVTGDIDLSRLRYTRRFDPEEVMLRGAGLKSAVVTRRSVFFENMELNIAVRADDNIHMENNFAQAELAADFRLVGTFRKPVLLGRVEVLNGFLFYRDRTFNIINASLDNFDSAAFNPVFDFRARTKVKSYNIYVSVNGTKEKMYPVISSEPSLPTIDVINLLALGKPRGSIYERSEETLMGIGLSSILSQSLVGGIEKGAAEIFGFDRFRIDPFLLGGKTDPTARLTVGKRITRDLNIIYSTNIGRTQEDVLILEYRLGDRTLFVASRDEYGAYGVEIQFESKF